MSTLGIHWITTTFATWLHGDPRGSWKDGQLIGPDPFLEESIQSRLSADAVVLDAVETMVVCVNFGATIREKKWRVYAATVQPTHAHVVFAPMPDNIDTAIATMKYRSACEVQNLRRKTFKVTGRSIWTAKPFPVFIYTEDHLHNAIEYVRNHNRRKNRPADPYEWIEPLYPPEDK